MKVPVKILILDDSSDLLEVLKLFLEKHFFEVSVADSLQSFKTELSNIKPEIILLDVFINGIPQGREICNALKLDKETSNIPIILMSTSPAGLLNFKDCKADAILDKPFSLAKLIETILFLLNPEKDLSAVKYVEDKIFLN